MSDPDENIVSLRLPADLKIRLRDYANEHGQTISQVLREQVRALTQKPIGWHCDHLSMGSPAGALEYVACAWGCDMRREYAA